MSKRYIKQIRYLLERKNIRLKDFLRVLEYEYALERRRIHKQKELKLNKTNDRDYASKALILCKVIKRIL